MDIKAKSEDISKKINAISEKLGLSEDLCCTGDELLPTIKEHYNIDEDTTIDDIKDLFQQENEIYAFNIKVDCFEEQRMELLMKQLKEETKSNIDLSRAIVNIFFPVCHPLLMSEFHHIYEWMESIPVEIMMKWGMATQSTQDLRAIVLLQ